MSLSGSFSGSGQDLGKLLEVISSDDRFQQRLKDLVAAEAAANAVIGLVGAAESIPVLHEKAKSELDQAIASRLEASEEAAAIIGKAKEDAVGIVSAANSEAERIKIDANAVLSSAESRASEIRATAEAVIASANERLASAEARLSVVSAAEASAVLAKKNADDAKAAALSAKTDAEAMIARIREAVSAK